MVQRWKTSILLSTVITFATGWNGTIARADVIYHAFNTPLRSLTSQLPTIQQQGYTYVQISPPQKSHAGAQWYFRYQPIDHTVIDSPLGNEGDLKVLMTAAHARRLKVIVDVVFNHMADEGDRAQTLNYPRFSARDFHPKVCINYGDRASVIRGWLGATCNLPDLNTENPYVRNEAKNYLKKLFQLGADGIRFDAGKHIEPDFFREMMSVIPPEKFVYSENIPENPTNSREFAAYTDISRFSILDFFLTRTLQEALRSGGDLRQLADVNLVGGRALPGTIAVTFARNHDTAKNTVTGYGFGDRQDVVLANAFLLARADGVPLIYGGDPRSPESGEPADSSLSDASYRRVQAGVIFHEQMVGKPQFFIPGSQVAPGADNPNTLFIRRGSDGLAIFNKAGTPFDVAAATVPGLSVGCYRELGNGFKVSIAARNNQPTIMQWATSHRAGLAIGPREALFLVRTSATPCR